MRKALISLAATASCALFIVIVIGSVTIIAQSTITGDWKADARPDKEGNKDGKIYVSFERSDENGRNQHGSNYSPEELGLRRDQMQNGKVSFRLVREAGTVDADGTFTDGRGTGTFRFTPDMGFVAAMKSRGFDFDRRVHRNDETIEERLLTAALINVTTALADDLNSANFGKLEVEDLYKAAIFKIDGKFMAEMKATGFPNLQMEDLVKARIFKIDADYVRQVRDMGFDNREFEGLVKFRIFKVTPEFLGELKNAGLANLDSEDIVKCRIFHIDGEFVRKARAQDPNVSLEDMVRMKIGVRKVKTDSWQ
ncbi:MAG TPA: hypothetical protein VGO43_06415 [Pyrinomonadaceae bacterium]|jgi:hypothetical protein|nr:hypothetical protein [Pyrinomonadaceae bacterium]